MTPLNIEIIADKVMCGATLFRINGVNADTSDFGCMVDDDPANAPEYGCGCRVFEKQSSDPQTLEKYGIAQEQYDKICEELRDKLYVGRCAVCS